MVKGKEELVRYMGILRVKDMRPLDTSQLEIAHAEVAACSELDPHSSLLLEHPWDTQQQNLVLLESFICHSKEFGPWSTN
jgi:hypothetical protein